MGNITHAGKPIIIDGVEYELAPVNLEDLEYLDDWVRGRVIRAARLSFDEGTSEAEKKMSMEAASIAAMESSVFSRGGVGQLLTPLGASRFLMRLLQRKHKEVTAAQCFAWLMRKDLKAELFETLLDKFTRASGGDVPSSGGGSDRPPSSTKVGSSESSSPPESNQTKLEKSP